MLRDYERRFPTAMCWGISNLLKARRRRWSQPNGNFWPIKRRNVLDRQRAQKEAERATIAATVEKLEASLPVLQERVEMRKTLYDHSTGSKANYLELLQPFVEGQQELKVQKSKISEADSAIAAIIEERAHTDAQYRRERSSELVEAERKARGLRDDVTKAQHRTRLQELLAPVAGTVQQL